MSASRSAWAGARSIIGRAFPDIEQPEAFNPAVRAFIERVDDPLPKIE